MIPNIFRRNLLEIVNRPSKHFKQLKHHCATIRIVEVGPRDGLQNESTFVPTDVKIEFINKLSQTGLQTIEVTSFVNPKMIPQMSDNSQVYLGITKNPSVTYPALILNVKGLNAALSAGVQEIAVAASASEGFSRKNANCSVEEGIDRIKQITEAALERNLKIRAYISCIVGCPYDGPVKPKAVSRIVENLLSLGCYEVSLGDTIGVGTIHTIQNLMKDLLHVTTGDKLAIHCHDTYGQALVNVATALEYGVKVIDSSVSGLGGCPYAPGATGNVATEDLVWMLQGLGLETGVDLKKLIQSGRYITEQLKKPNGSKVNNALYEKYCLS